MIVATESGPGSAARRPAVLTGPLLLFLLAVGTAVGLAVRSRYPSPDLPGTVRLLADGDLDGAERARQLARVVALAAGAEATADRWAGLLAAIALGDREAHAKFRSDLGGDRPQLPEPAARELLHLGDPMLGNVLAAMVAEATDPALARQKWSQVAAQARLTAHAFARELAAAALPR
ncbi:MAG: hypothetical protein MUC36_08230 [Planctomycetes bacterium]|jgi:hypothetical protein|nr:hypothetical protein [Planctomycetota bacterium]